MEKNKNPNLGLFLLVFLVLIFLGLNIFVCVKANPYFQDFEYYFEIFKWKLEAFQYFPFISNISAYRVSSFVLITSLILFSGTLVNYLAEDSFLEKKEG